MSWNQFYVAVETHFHAHERREAAHQVVAHARIPLTTLHQQHTELFAFTVRRGKCHCVAGPNFGLSFGNVLKILGPNITPVNNDQVFLAASNG